MGVGGRAGEWKGPEECGQRALHGGRGRVNYRTLLGLALAGSRAEAREETVQAMHEPVAKDDEGCAARCARCAPQDPQADPPAEGPVAALSAAFFLVPLVTAIAGAVVFPLLWGHDVSQLLGGVVGLVSGIVASALVVRRIRGARKKQDK